MTEAGIEATKPSPEIQGPRRLGRRQFFGLVKERVKGGKPWSCFRRCMDRSYSTSWRNKRTHMAT